jgi:hypothetical protein
MKKLDRAKLRMKELDNLLQSFHSAKPYKFSAKPDPRYGTVISMDEVAPVPDEVSLVAGDVLQNLRSALDHLAYQLYLKGGGAPGTGRHVSFPIYESKQAYDDNKARRTRGMTQAATAKIESLAPYKGANDLLWQINELNNIDKHRIILLTGSAVRSMDIMPMLAHSAPEPLRSKMSNMKFFVKPADNSYPLKVGTVIQTHPAIKKVAFEIVLYEQGVIDGASLNETLTNMVSAVENVISDFQALI